jgi:hypothetical protein
MQKLPNALSGFRSTRWTTRASAVPPDWSDALARGEAQSHG